jgi:hypothetical protein
LKKNNEELVLHAFYYPAHVYFFGNKSGKAPTEFNYLAIQNPAQIDDQRDCAWIEIFLII